MLRIIVYNKIKIKENKKDNIKIFELPLLGSSLIATP